LNTWLSAFPVGEIKSAEIGIRPSKNIAQQFSNLSMHVEMHFVDHLTNLLKQHGKYKAVIDGYSEGRMYGFDHFLTKCINNFHMNGLSMFNDHRVGTLKKDLVAFIEPNKSAQNWGAVNDEVNRIVDFAVDATKKAYQDTWQTLQDSIGKNVTGQSISLNVQFTTKSERDSEGRGLFAEESSIERTIFVDHGVKKIYHDNFVISREDQGKGYAKQLFRNCLALYDKMGIQKIAMSANVDMGSYAWAKYGFVPTIPAWKKMKEHMEHSFEELEAAGAEVPPEVKQLVTELTNNKNPKALWIIADIPVWGKALLTVPGTRWDGELDLAENSPERKRLENYIGE
jgi:hypothetical protein